MRNANNDYDNKYDNYNNYNNNYNRGYNNQTPYGNYPPPQKSSNTGLIAVIAVLSGCIIIAAVIIILLLTGIIPSGLNKNSNNAAGDVPVATVAPTAVPASAAVPAAPIVPENTTVVAQKYVANVKNSIHLRSAPAENDSNIICEIPLGTQVGFIENTDSVFAKINYNGTVGYSKRQYLSDYMPNTSGNTTISSYMYVANVKNSIYFRSAPAENDGNIICEIPLGTMVGFIERYDGVFSKISYNGSIGYVKSQYLSSSRSSAKTSGGSTMTVVNVKNSIYLRSTPSEESDSNIIMEIPLGATVTYLGTPNGTFYKISYGGTVGYSKQIYLSFN